MGFVFQFFHLVPRLSAEQNIALPLVLSGVLPPERRDRTARMLEAVGLSDRGHHRPDQLSGGQRQRVAIARAMIMEPSVLLADEPTGNLDAASEAEILVLLKRLNEEFGKTLIMVTHDPRAAAYADRVLHLDKGVLSETGA